MKHLLLYSTILFLVTSCKTNQSPIVISFGSGGGFSGGFTTYSFSNDGKLYREESMQKTKVQIGTLTKKQVKEAIEQSTKLNFSGLNINNPGNLSNFVNVKQGDKEYKTTWGGSTSGNTALDRFSKYLLTLISKK